MQTRKLRSRPRRTSETNSFPVMRHQAGKSSSTEISVERNSEELAARERIDVLADQQEQAIAAVELAPVEARASKACRSTASTRS